MSGRKQEHMRDFLAASCVPYLETQFQSLCSTDSAIQRVFALFRSYVVAENKVDFLQFRKGVSPQKMEEDFWGGVLDLTATEDFRGVLELKPFNFLITGSCQTPHLAKAM